MEELLKVGIITSTHGVRGEMKIYPTTDDVTRFKGLKSVILDTGKEKRPMQIEGVKFFKQTAILKFKGIDSMEDAERLRRGELYVERKDAVKLEADEYFIADMIGMDVYEENGDRLGTLCDVLTTGANDVYVVRMDEGAHPQVKAREVLLPAIKQCVLAVSVEEKKMTVHVMEGLLD